jgi:hypothetical protein
MRGERLGQPRTGAFATALERRNLPLSRPSTFARGSSMGSVGEPSLDLGAAASIGCGFTHQLVSPEPPPTEQPPVLGGRQPRFAFEQAAKRR